MSTTKLLIYHHQAKSACENNFQKMALTQKVFPKARQNQYLNDFNLETNDRQLILWDQRNEQNKYIGLL